MTEIHHILGNLEPWIRAYGSVTIFLILTFESFGMPLPGESLLIVAAILAGRGEISFPVLLLAAWCGAVLGDNIGYLVGRMFGQSLIRRYGEKIGLKPDRLQKVEMVFARYGPVTVGFARFFNVLRQLNGVVAGTLEMDWRQFLVFNALGGALWVGVWTTVGYYLSKHGAEFAVLVHRIGIYGTIVSSTVIAAILICLTLFIFRQRNT